MITAVTKLVIGLFITLSSVQNIQEPILGTYLELKEALVRDNSEEAALHSGHLLHLLEGHEAAGKDLLKIAGKLAQSKGIERQREAFAELSPLFREFLNASNYEGPDLYYQYCPMKKAYWLSATAEIRNPYYGSRMLNCGSVKETISY